MLPNFRQCPFKLNLVLLVVFYLFGCWFDDDALMECILKALPIFRCFDGKSIRCNLIVDEIYLFAKAASAAMSQSVHI